jgi:hypothetical protein
MLSVRRISDVRESVKIQGGIVRRNQYEITCHYIYKHEIIRGTSLATA